MNNTVIQGQRDTDPRSKGQIQEVKVRKGNREVDSTRLNWDKFN